MIIKSELRTSASIQLEESVKKDLESLQERTIASLLDENSQGDESDGSADSHR